MADTEPTSRPTALNDPRSPYYNAEALGDVGIRFKGAEEDQCRRVSRQREFDLGRGRQGAGPLRPSVDDQAEAFLNLFQREAMGYQVAAAQFALRRPAKRRVSRPGCLRRGW